MAKPKNIILIVADSLRHDSVYHSGDVGLPYIAKNAIQYTEARSAGCWTLPATASLFTGLMPHQHGATTQTRKLRKDVKTLAEIMQDNDYATAQVTANPVTTHIFGVDRGFQETWKIWELVKPRFRKLLRFAVIAGKPRVRKMLFTQKDEIADQLASDLKVGVTWTQLTHQDSFNKAREIIRNNEQKGKGTFMFINLMESHFPYHIDEKFKLSAKGFWNKLEEAKHLFHTLNQSFLKSDKTYFKERFQLLLKERQYTAWTLLNKNIDAFVREFHEDKDNLIVFCSDHGENFGEQDWMYHFSNVTDAGNKVPLFWLDHEHKPAETVQDPISARFIFQSFANAIGHSNGASLLNRSEETTPILQSYWYNNQGKTLDKYIHNQFCFVDELDRYRFKGNAWYHATTMQNGIEPPFVKMEKNINPIEELDNNDKKRYVQQSFSDFRSFSSSVMKEL